MTAIRVSAPWILAVAMAVVVALPGCAAAPADAAAMTPSPSATAPPSPVPSTTASAAPSPSPTLVDPLLISARGIGPYQLGGSFAEARELLGVDERQASYGDSFEDRCPWFASGGDLDPLMTYVVSEIVTRDGGSAAGDVITSVAVQDGGTGDAPMPHTGAGIGLRSSEAEVRAAYPDASQEDLYHADSALRITDGDTSIVFEFRDGLAYFITVLPATEPISPEYCG